MNHHHTHIILLALLMTILAASLSGCISRRINDRFKIREEVKPERILVGQDGTIGVQLTAIPYQKRFFGHDEKIPVKDQKPRTCYLIMSPFYVNKYIACVKSNKYLTTVTQDQTLLISVDWPEINEATLDDKEKSIIPRGFLAPSASIENLPPTLQAPSTQEFPVPSTVLYKATDKTVYLKFEKYNIHSFRSKDTWPQIFAIPVFIVEAPIEWAGTVASFPLVVLGWSAIGVMHGIDQASK